MKKIVDLSPNPETNSKLKKHNYENKIQEKVIFNLTKASLVGKTYVEMEHAICASPGDGKNGFGDGKSFAKAAKGKAGWSNKRIEKILECATKEPNPIFTYDDFTRHVTDALKEYDELLAMDKLKEFERIIQSYLLIAREFSPKSQLLLKNLLTETIDQLP